MALGFDAVASRRWSAPFDSAVRDWTNRPGASHTGLRAGSEITPHLRSPWRGRACCGGTRQEHSSGGVASVRRSAPTAAAQRPDPRGRAPSGLQSMQQLAPHCNVSARRGSRDPRRGRRSYFALISIGSSFSMISGFGFSSTSMIVSPACSVIVSKVGVRRLSVRVSFTPSSNFSGACLPPGPCRGV